VGDLSALHILELKLLSLLLMVMVVVMVVVCVQGRTPLTRTP
jgi:hypothetical protein